MGGAVLQPGVIGGLIDLQITLVVFCLPLIINAGGHLVAKLYTLCSGCAKIEPGVFTANTGKLCFFSTGIPVFFVTLKFAP